MANNRQFTYEIFEQDCLGNSAGKHNFNSLSLETQICNLSSSFMSPNNLFTTSLSGFLAQVDKLKQFGDLNRFNKTFTTVSLLSSYWNVQDFSVLYPLNISSQGGQSIVGPTSQTPATELISLAQSYLTANFPNSSYTPNTRASVNMFVYNYPSNPYDPNILNSVTNSNEFSFTNRSMNVSMSRQDIHLEKGNIFQFSNINNKWASINVLGPTVVLDSTTNRKKITLTINSNQINFNVGDVIRKMPEYVQGHTDVVLTINSGVIISSGRPEDAALSIANLSNGDYVFLFNNGIIIGCGGSGGQGGDSLDTKNTKGAAGSRGGPAIAAFVPCTIENHGHIYAGGGGGAGGTGGLTGSTSVGGGGGGGAGIYGGTGGRRGTNIIYRSKGVFVNDGLPGERSLGGIGGPGLSTDPLATGGNGGNIGKPGFKSDSADGGPAGYYILGNSNVFWAITGDVKGEVS